MKKAALALAVSLLAGVLMAQSGPTRPAGPQEPVVEEPAPSQETTVRDGGSSNVQYDGPASPERPAPSGVATGFIAAGLGVALLGLAVQRRRHHRGPSREEEEDRFEGGDLQ